MNYYPLRATGYLPETLILANGSFPKHPLLLDWLKRCDYIVCCDGAADDLLQRGIKPVAIVGDCDSLSASSRSEFAAILHPDSDQETNDLTKSVRFCLAQGRSNLTIIGATAKREDHTLGNISLLTDYMADAQIEMFTDYGVFTPISTDSSFQSFAGQQVSLFAMDAGELTVTNLKYPVVRKSLHSWWQGTLNESLGNEFRIHPTGSVIVFRVY